MDNYLELKNIALKYQTKNGETEALKNISFSIKKQEFVSIVGPSGCGKTTILSLIAKLFEPTSGEILLESKKIEKCNGTIGYMFQRDHLFEWRTIYSNVMLGLELYKKHKDKGNIDRVENLLKK